MKKVFTVTGLLLSLIWVVNSEAITLQEGLSIVSKQSRDVMKALQEEDLASAKVREAWSYYLPQVELYGYQTYLRYQPEGRFGPFGPVPMGEKDFLTYGFRVSQLLYDFGSLSSNISATKAELKATRFTTVSVRNTMALEFIRRYLGVLEAERLLEVARDQERAYGEHLHDTRLLYDNGLVTKNDLLQAEVAFAEAEQERINAENLLNVRKTALNIILKRAPDNEISVEEPPSPLNIDITLQEAYKKALKARPELAVLQGRIEALFLRKKAVGREFLPRLYLAGGYEYQQNQYMVHEGNWSVILGMKVDIFSGGQKLARLKELEAQIKAVEIEMDKLKENIKLQVKNAYLKLHSARGRLSVAQKAVKQAEENYRLHNLRYKEGAGTSTDVTDALVLVRTQKTNYYKAVYELKEAEAELLYAMGADLVSTYTSSGRKEVDHEE